LFYSKYYVYNLALQIVGLFGHQISVNSHEERRNNIFDIACDMLVLKSIYFTCSK